MTKKIYRPHFSTTSDARVVRTRESLRQAMLALLTNKPFEQISIRELAAHAGIGYTTFFRHHPTKESLLEEIVAKGIQELAGYVVNTFNTIDRKESSLAMCQYVYDHRNLWTILLTGGAADAVRNEFILVAKEFVVQVPGESDWLPLEFGVVLIASTTIELLSWWLCQEEEIPLDKIALIYENAVLTNILNTLDRK